MLKQARRCVAAAPYPVRLVEAEAESLPFDDGEFDHLWSKGIVVQGTARLRRVRPMAPRGH